MVREANYSINYLTSQENYMDQFETNTRNVTMFISNHFTDFYDTCANNIFQYYVYFEDKYSVYETFEDFMFGFMSNMISYVVFFEQLTEKLQKAEEAGDQIEVWKIIGRIAALYTDFDP